MGDVKTRTADLADALSPIQLTVNLTQQATAQRKQAVEQLYIRNRWFIDAEASSDLNLRIDDIERVAASVANHLDEYSGPPDSDDRFQEWVAGIVQPAITHLAHCSQFEAIYAEHRAIVQKAIWSIVGKCADLGVDHQTLPSLENQVWMQVFLKLDELLAPGSAKLSTRLYAMARFQAMGWRTDRLRNRAKFTTLDEAIRIEEGLSVSKRRGVGRGPDDLDTNDTGFDLHPEDGPDLEGRVEQDQNTASEEVLEGAA